MFKKVIIVIVVSILIYSCGTQTTSSSGGGTSTPSTCNYTRSDQYMKNNFRHNLNEEKRNAAHFEEALFSPYHNVKKLSQKKNRPILNIVGGETLDGEAIVASLKCQANSNSTKSVASYQAMATTNTVAITISTANATELCTGTLVTTDLILTAAHCFDNFTTNGVTPSGSAITIFFNSNVTTSNGVTTNAISWSRNPGHDPTEPNTAAQILNDIAWVKIASGVAASHGYSPVNVLANPQSTISATEEKLSIGYGKTSDTSGSDGLQRCVSTYADSKYSSRGDVIVTGAAATFNAQTSANAYQNYLAVFGPVNGNNPRGTCNGDSGGPNYVFRNGSWVLAALTQGTNSILSPKPCVNFAEYTTSTNLTTKFTAGTYATCNDGYGVYTTVGNYASWLAQSTGSPNYGANETITTQ